MIADELCLKVFKKKLIEYRWDAYKTILPHVKPEDIEVLDGDDSLESLSWYLSHNPPFRPTVCLEAYALRGAQREAAVLTAAGRQTYMEAPRDIVTYYKSKGMEVEKIGALLGS